MNKPLLAAALCLALASCGRREEGGNAATSNAQTTQAPKAEGMSVAAALADMSDHQSLAKALKAAGLEPTLSGKQPYTLFAPTDAAFSALPSDKMQGLMASENKAQLTSLLAGHIVPGLVTAADLAAAIDRGKGQAKLVTASGSTLTVTRDGGSLLIVGPGGTRARLVGAERLQSNGAIHSVDGVLLPR